MKSTTILMSFFCFLLLPVFAAAEGEDNQYSQYYTATVTIVGEGAWYKFDIKDNTYDGCEQKRLALVEEHLAEGYSVSSEECSLSYAMESILFQEVLWQLEDRCLACPGITWFPPYIKFGDDPVPLKAKHEELIRELVEVYRVESYMRDLQELQHNYQVKEFLNDVKNIPYY